MSNFILNISIFGRENVEVSLDAGDQIPLPPGWKQQHYGTTGCYNYRRLVLGFSGPLESQNLVLEVIKEHFSFIVDDLEFIFPIHADQKMVVVGMKFDRSRENPMDCFRPDIIYQ